VAVENGVAVAEICHVENYQNLWACEKMPEVEYLKILRDFMKIHCSEKVTNYYIY
jgi:hypothetical protein